MREPFDTLFPALQDEVRRVLCKHPECHGWDHTVRVWHNARRLAEAEGADAAVVAYAAMLHDIGRVDEDQDSGRTCHAAVGAARVPGILRALGIEDESFIGHVAECVRTHRYRGRAEASPGSAEARAVFDADKLDALGAIGIGRAFHFAGRIGARVHNTEAEALGAAAYSREDSAYREFLVKLRHLSGEMTTVSGRRMAEDRYRFMCAFFDRLQREVDASVSGHRPEARAASAGTPESSCRTDPALT